VLLRLPRDLHGQVKEEAVEQGVSTNTLLVALIAGGVGFKHTGRAFDGRAETPARGGRRMSALTEMWPEHATSDYDAIAEYYAVVRAQDSVIQRKTLNYLARAERAVTWHEVEQHFGWEPRTIHRSFGGSGRYMSRRFPSSRPTHVWNDDDGTFLFSMEVEQRIAWLMLEAGGRV